MPQPARHADARSTIEARLKSRGDQVGGVAEHDPAAPTWIVPPASASHAEPADQGDDHGHPSTALPRARSRPHHHERDRVPDQGPKPTCRNGGARWVEPSTSRASIPYWSSWWSAIASATSSAHISASQRQQDLCGVAQPGRTVSLAAHGHHARPAAEHRADRRPRRPAPLHRLRHRDQAALRPDDVGPTSRSAWASRRVPLHARDPPGHVPRPQVDDAPVRGLRDRPGDQRALPLPDRARLDRPVDGVRPAHPARPRLGRPALHGRGRPHRRGHRHDRRHAPGVRRHPARPRSRPR